MKTATPFIVLVFSALLTASSAHNHEHKHKHLDDILQVELPSNALPKEHLFHRHKHHAHEDNDTLDQEQTNSEPLQKRGGQCQFPTDAGLVPITPNEMNAGFAMSPNQQCTPGNWCPYACPPGQLSGQWDPAVTSYSYPGSQYGGLQCDENGNMQKPFPNKPYCYDGTGAVSLNNKCSGGIALCQTVLPGNEAMLIPTNINPGSSETIAVPDPSYWASTAAHYYVNPPGVSTSDGCVWGTSANPYGNWSPYVAGANTDGNGNTFVKIGWNPIYLDGSGSFSNTLPNFGVRIVCEEGSNCNGLPCSIDPSTNALNSVTSGEASDGAGGAGFCVVTAENYGKAVIEVFEVGSGSGSDSGSSSSSSSGSSSQSSSQGTTSGSSSSSSQDSSSQEQAPSSPSIPSTSSSSSTPPPPPSTSSTPPPPPTTSSVISSSSTLSSSSYSPPPPSTSSSTTSSTSSTSSIAPTSSSIPSSTQSPTPTPTSASIDSREALNLLAQLEPSSSTAITSNNFYGVSYVSNLAVSRTALYNLANANVTVPTGFANSSSSEVSSTPSTTVTTSASSEAGTSSSSSSTTSSKSSAATQNIQTSLMVGLLMAVGFLLL
ncbi:hypothetical protein AWJ20_1873 [Sugiyamaella lignohabitans]|uniref:Uncharacterized protein n=1 Tax=Sugiyamaella lignohabitans TaxID=796027 RepID=A0A161HKL1_9ASCO|nr:uncharacterized protein AWJ20_1873 [Sugiyamaella lignohabitans]ANB13577.1 hypothetical protein AWJ20_1873 [Sugiyamaella lignohabitans]